MRSVLITGTSTGIGQATAVVLASRGWRVFATMRNLAKRGLLEQALKEAGVQNGVEVEELDVTSVASDLLRFEMGARRMCRSNRL
jgi:NAD(P)-dependent dehydrogenase (short-subunit alcohol dehydrogenase family)